MHVHFKSEWYCSNDPLSNGRIDSILDGSLLAQSLFLSGGYCSAWNVNSQLSYWSRYWCSSQPFYCSHHFLPRKSIVEKEDYCRNHYSRRLFFGAPLESRKSDWPYWPWVASRGLLASASWPEESGKTQLLFHVPHRNAYWSLGVEDPPVAWWARLLQLHLFLRPGRYSSAKSAPLWFVGQGSAWSFFALN